MATTSTKPRGRLIVLLLGLLASCLVIAVSPHWLLHAMELKTLDWRFRTRPALPLSDRICHVDIDDAAIASLGRFQDWSRVHHAEAIKTLTELGARSVAFDIEFRQPSETSMNTAVLGNFLLQQVAVSFDRLVRHQLETLSSRASEAQGRYAVIVSDPEELTNLLLSGAEDLIQRSQEDFQGQIPNDDGQLAEAIEHSGRVFLAASVTTERDSDPTVTGNVRRALERNFELDAPTLADMLKLPAARVANRLVTTKERLAFDRLWNRLQEGNLTDEQAVHLFMPNFDLAAQTSAEKDIVLAAADRVRSGQMVVNADAFVCPPECIDRFPAGVDLNPPIYRFARVAKGFGLTNASPDAEDGVVRRVPAFIEWRGLLVPHMSLAYSLDALGATDCKPDPDGRGVLITVADSTEPILVPTDRDGQILINWAGNGSRPWTETFSHISFGSLVELQALRGNLRQNENYMRVVDHEYLRDQWTSVHDQIEPLQGAQRTRALTDDEATKLAALLEQREKVELDLLDFLNRNLAPYQGKDLGALEPEERELVERMTRVLHNVPEVRRLRSVLDDRLRELKQRLTRQVRDRFCIVGMTAQGSTDMKNTSILTYLPGVAIHGFVLNSILTRNFIYQVPSWMNVALTLLIGMTVTALAGSLPTIRAAAFTVLVLLAYVLVTYLLLSFQSLWIAVAMPLASGFLTYAVIASYRQLTEERQKRHIKNAFQHYLAPSVVEEILQDPKGLQLGGQRKEVTVFFSDVQGFTPIAETLEPEALTALLNEYLNQMSDVILSNQGYLNKFAGDGIMAIFGAPLDQPDHADRACRAALESQRRLVEFRERLTREGRPVIYARIGINSGPMIVGNMGSDRLFDYTAIGDNVNVGSRLEAANKPFATGIIIGDNTWHMVKDRFECRRLGLVTVKGRVRPVGAHELLGVKGELSPAIAQLLPHYEEGLIAYSRRDFAAAVVGFQRALEVNPSDGPSHAYLERCRHFITAGETHTTWDGSFALDNKE